MYNYLKKILFTLLILGMPYMNSMSKAMDVEDYEGAAVRAHKVSFVTKKTDFLHIENLDASEISWASYLISPVKSALQLTDELVKFAISNPKLATVVGLSYILPKVSAACMCYCCYRIPLPSCPNSYDIDCAPSESLCKLLCDASPDWSFDKCLVDRQCR